MSVCLWFLEERRDAEFVIEAAGTRANNVFLALSPRSSYELDKLGIAYRNPEDYYSADELARLGRERTMPLLAAACEYGDGFLERHSPTCRRYGLRPFEANRYKLSFAFDSVWATVFALRRVFSRERPSSVRYFSTTLDVLGEELAFREESIASGLLPLCAGAWNVPGECMRRPIRPTRLPWRQRIARVRRRLGERLRRSADPAWVRSSNGVGAEASGRVFVALDQEYDIGPVAEQMMRDRSGRLIAWDSGAEADGSAATGVGFAGASPVGDVQGATIDELTRGWESLRKDETFRAFFRFEGLDAFPILERRLAHLVNHNALAQLVVHHRAQRLFDRVEPAAVIAAEINSYWRIEIAKVASARKIPVVVYQHGGSYGYAQAHAHEYTALKWADFFLGYGEGVADAFALKRVDPESAVRARVIPTGSARLDRLAGRRAAGRAVQAASTSRTTVVYVCDAMVGRTRRLPPVDYENNQYFRWQKRVIATFERHPSVSFLIKPFPDPRRHSPLPDYVRDRRAAHLRIVEETPFSELLGTADLFLIDYVGTALLEALTTTKKIVLFADRVARDIAPAALDVLKRRVVCATSIDDYLAAIDAILRARAWGDVASTGDEFLKMYGTHLNDGRSCERAVDVLLQIASDPWAVEVTPR